MDLNYFNNQKTIEKNQVNGFIAILNSDECASIDVAHIAKSIEIMGISPDLNYPDLMNALASGVSRISSLSGLSSTDRLYLSRALIRVSGATCNDGDYVNMHGEVEVGERTLECFSGRILELFYEEQ
jgi:hypothetical protein